MKTSSAKAKGRRLCQGVVSRLLGVFNGKLQDADFQVTSSGATGEDITMSPLARQMFPFSIECKNQESLNIWKALEQAKSNCKEHTPLVVFSRNRSEVYCALKFDDLLKMFESKKHGTNPTT